MLRAMLGSNRWPKILDKGYQTLWKEVAKTLPKVRTSVQIDRIDRGDNRVTVHMKDAGTDQMRSETFDHLIVTCCLDSTLGRLIHDLTDGEKRFFEETQYNQYYSMSWRSQEFPDGQSGDAGHTGAGHRTPARRRQELG